jgi:hypothetical protein
MSTLVSILVLVAVSVLFWLTARTLVREMRTGIPHLFFSPHPAYRNRPVNRKSPFLWFSALVRVWCVLILGLMVFVAVLFLLESLGVIYQ